MKDEKELPWPGFDGLEEADPLGDPTKWPFKNIMGKFRAIPEAQARALFDGARMMINTPFEAWLTDSGEFNFAKLRTAISLLQKGIGEE